MQITRKQDPETYDAVMFCIKAKANTDLDYYPKPLAISLLCVNKGRLITTDKHRLHLAKISLPNGLYEYSKAKNTITLRLTEHSKYPNVSNVIPKTFAHTLTVNRKDLLRRCRQANVIKLDRWQGLTLTFNGRLDLRIVNPDIGTMDAHVDTDRPIDPEIKVGMSVRYLIDALTGLKGNEITIGLNDETMPLILRTINQAALIMPMKA